jgi:phage gp45-like
VIEQIRDLGAKVRNLFAAGEFQKRYGDGRIQVKTHNGRVIEKKEAFPYGFYAKAKSGKAFVICQGGNLDGFEIFPVQPGDDVTPPALEEGDVSVYTGKGGYIVLREAGDVEVHAKSEGKVMINTEGGDISINARSAGGIQLKTAGGAISVDATGAGNVTLTGNVKTAGGSFECGGAVPPTGQGALCAMPYCAFTGAPQSGHKAAGT